MASIQGVYIALFGRPADPSGLAYFNSVTKNGTDLSGIGDLTKTSEYLNRFNGLTNEQIVNSIYKSLFNRDGEKTGIDFFLGKLASGELTINNIAIAILDGAQGDDLVTVKAKIDAANLFTSHLDLQLEIDAYRGNTAAQIGRDFITAVTKTDPGTAEKADAAILKVVQNQGQAPGGDTGTGGGGGDSGSVTPVTFSIVKEKEGIAFDGNAKGTITLGQVAAQGNSGEPSPQILKALYSPSVLTGERGGVPASIQDGPIYSTKGVLISESALTNADNADLALKDGLHVSMSAATASEHTIGGSGSVTIFGSKGSQTVHVTATYGNEIAGGLDADVIDIKGASGVDTIKVNGVADSDARNAIGNASAARDAVEARETLKTQAADLSAKAAAFATTLEKANKDVADAQTVVKNAQIAFNVADAADKIAGTLAKAVGDLDKTIKDFFKFGVNSLAITLLKMSIQNNPIIPQDLKATILGVIPTDVKDFKVSVFLDKVHSYIDAYKEQADTARDNAQDKLDIAKDHLSDLQKTASGAKHDSDSANAAAAEKATQLDDARDETKGGKSDASLALDKQNAENAVGTFKDKILTDSMIGNEDKVVGFDLGHDHLQLPGYQAVGDVSEAGFTFGDHHYSVSVTDGIGHIAEIGADTSSPIALSGDLLKAALNYLSDDHVVKQGETVAFDYMEGNDSGLYVFQGGDYGSDIGVKLVGVHADDVVDLTHIIGGRG